MNIPTKEVMAKTMQLLCESGQRTGQAVERDSVVTFLRAEAKKGTADWEYRLTKLADAIERGDHEQA